MENIAVPKFDVKDITGLSIPTQLPDYAQNPNILSPKLQTLIDTAFKTINSFPLKFADELVPQDIPDEKAFKVVERFLSKHEAQLYPEVEMSLSNKKPASLNDPFDAPITNKNFPKVLLPNDEPYTNAKFKVRGQKPGKKGSLKHLLSMNLNMNFNEAKTKNPSLKKYTVDMDAEQNDVSQYML